LIQPKNHTFVKEGRPAHSREKTSLDSPPVLVYGFAAGGTRPFAGACEFDPEGTLKVESVKPPKTSADPGSLHKKMMQLLSSLWVTHAIGTFARLGLADAMEAGAEDAGRRSPSRAAFYRSGLSSAARALDLRHRHGKRRRQSLR
jgi:hypothetical protein